MSFSSNSDFQACQWRYLLSHIYGLTSEKDKDALRIGETWHRCHEILEMQPDGKCPDCLRHEEIRPTCDLCAGTGYLPEDMMDAVARHLNRVYSVVPDNKTREDWELERVNLLYSLSGHRWLYGDDQRFDVIGSEIKCVIPVINPATGRKVPKAKFVLKVDKLVRDRSSGLIYVWERKSTSQSITDADYWEDLGQGDQVTGYVYGVRVAQYNGQLVKYGIRPSDPPVAGAFCDVWHKPDISPKMLTQADTAVFVKTGEYCGEKFTVGLGGDGVTVRGVSVNRTQAAIAPGKKEGTFAIRETPEMFGARLLLDIAGRPEHYFAQREVARTDKDLEAFQWHIFNLAQQIRCVEKKNLWCKNVKSCRAKFHCEFIGLCRSGVEVGPDVIPPGYVNKYERPAQEEVSS
jgi:hypothetical protein